jgi:hypothetical protein
MLDKLIKNISTKHQGLLSLLMGLILILGALSKLGALQGILNTIMIAVGAVLLFWGINKSGTVTQIQKLLKK